MRTAIRTVATRGFLITALATVLIPVLTEEAAFGERPAHTSGGAALAERLADVAASSEASRSQVASEAAEPDDRMRSQALAREWAGTAVASLQAATGNVAKKAARVTARPKDEASSPSLRAEKGGRIRLAAAGRGPSATERRTLLRAGLAVGDAEMRTALPGPQSTEGRVVSAMNFRARHPDLQIPGEDAGSQTRLVSRFADLGAEVDAAKKDELLSLAYAPAPSAQPKSSLFDQILGDRSKGFVPPLGPKDHSWAATPLPASAFSKKEQACLATAIYFEARSEEESGQAAVAQVILNRVRNPTFPDTICDVVYQNQNWRNRCQFSFACDGKKDRITNRRAHLAAQRIARDVTSGDIWLPEVGSATHYHATYVNPRWARAMERVDKIGLHIFYRTFGGGWD